MLQSYWLRFVVRRGRSTGLVEGSSQGGDGCRRRWMVGARPSVMPGLDSMRFAVEDHVVDGGCRRGWSPCVGVK